MNKIFEHCPGRGIWEEEYEAFGADRATVVGIMDWVLMENLFNGNEQDIHLSIGGSGFVSSETSDALDHWHISVRFAEHYHDGPHPSREKFEAEWVAPE